MTTNKFTKPLKSVVRLTGIFLVSSVLRIKWFFSLLCPFSVALLFPLLTANGQQAGTNLTPSRAHIDFGNARVGNSSNQTETLTNTGSATIIISAASAGGTGFSLGTIPLPLTLNAGKSATFNVKFTPTSIGKWDGQITIISNDSATNLVINLTAIVERGNLVPDPNSIGFGTLQVGTNRSPTVTLTNEGGTNVNISAATLSGSGFSLNGSPAPLTLKPGESSSFKVTFKPTTVGSTSGVVTIASDGSNPSLVIALFGTGVDILDLPACSLAKTNNDCKLTIDRENPLTPPTIQMYSNQKLTVIVTTPKTYERYFLDYQSGQATLTPDITSSIVQGLLPSLAKFGEFYGFDQGASRKATNDQCAVSGITDTTMPAAGTVKDLVKPVLGCLTQLSTKAIGIYRSLEPYVGPDSSVRSVSTTNESLTDQQNLDELANRVEAFLKPELALSSRISAISADQGLKAAAADTRAITELTDLQKLADAVANDLLAYRLRISDLDGYDNWFDNCNALIDFEKERKKVATKPVSCVWITSKPDDDAVYDKMVTRTVVYSLNVLNLISNSQEAIPDPSKKKLLTSVTINFADAHVAKSSELPHSALRLEASAGTFFSTLPIRSFSVTPVFTKDVITDKTISQNVLHPTVVPFAAANYRLTDDLAWTRWKSNLYLTGGVGINPNTVSADFATGLSLSWRALMISGLAHFGHDVRLTQGLEVGQSLGPGFNGNLPTHTFWTTSFAVGVSIRVPSLTGR